MRIAAFLERIVSVRRTDAVRAAHAASLEIMIMPAAQTTSSMPSSSTDVSPNDAETVVGSHQTLANASATKIGHPPAAPLSPVPSLHELEDVLYDLLAAGGDLNVSTEKVELIQVFLHEHSRQRKSHAQVVSFFETQGLSMRPERPNWFALPIVDSSSRAGTRTPPLLTAEPELDAAVAEPMLADARQRFAWIWPALGCAAICGALALGASAIVVMRSELVRMNAAVQQSTIEIEQLRAETERLRAIVQSNSVAAQHAERDTQLLLQTLAAPIAQNSR